MRGERKLTDQQLEDIRKARATPCPHCGTTRTLKSIGDEYGVSAVLVHSIVHRKKYFR